MIDPADLATVKVAYGLQDFEAIVPAVGPLAGSALSGPMVTAPKAVLAGPTGTYLVKRVPWYCDFPSQANAVANMQRSLRLRGVPLPDVLTSLSGGAALTLRDRRSERTFVVQEYVLDAAALPMSTEALTKMGAAVSCLHAASAQLSHTEPAVASLPTFDAFRCARRAAWRTLRQGYLRAPSYLRLTLQVERLRRASCRAGYRRAPLVVHGDVNPTNFIVTRSKHVLIVDFDNACRDNPVHDIARALAHLGLFSNPTLGARRFPSEAPIVREQAMSSFLAGYATERGCPVPIAWEALGPTVHAVGIELICLSLLNGWIKPRGIEQWLDQVKRLATTAAAASPA